MTTPNLSIETQPAATEELIALGQGERLEPGSDQLPHRRFEEIARGRPDLVAVVSGYERLTYGEVDARANRLARQLRDAGVVPECVVGICLPRRAEVVIAVLAVLKAGGAYLPLDPSYPIERRRFMLGDAGASALITAPAWAPDLDIGSLRVLSPGRPPAAAEPPTWEPPAASNLAYVMYTSGSTGQPKGVMIEHRSVAAFVSWGLRDFSTDELDGVLASTSLGFDISVFELLVPLSAGGRVILVDQLLAIDGAADAGVTLVNTVPSLMAALLKDRQLPPSVETVILAGEPLSAELVEQVHAQPGVRRVVNGYGPTEDTIYSTVGDVAPGARPSIGRPIPGGKAYVLDSKGQLAPPGVAGELYLGGAGLARGYRGREELTRERFIALPSPEGDGERVYRTGDLARWREDGYLDHLGRIDHQVKVRGVRIEPAEVEGALMRHPNVRQAVVLARAHESGEQRLVAYLVCDGASPGRAELRALLRQTLPDAMVPSAFVTIDEMPLTANGKLDRERLPDPTLTRDETAPGTDTERELAEMWRESLGLAHQPGPDEDFFDLGGQSLLAFTLFDRLVERFGCDLSPDVLVEASTIRALAERIEAAARIDTAPAAGDTLVRLHPQGSRTPVAYVHAVSGGMFPARAFSAALGPDRPFFGLHAFADWRESRGKDTSVVEGADRCLSLLREVQPEGPYLLAGYSIGGYVVYEMACRLQAEGEEVRYLGLVDQRAPHTVRFPGRVIGRMREIAGFSEEGRRPDAVAKWASVARDAALSRAPRMDGPAIPLPSLEADDPAFKGMTKRLERAYRPGRFRGDVTVFYTAQTARFAGGAGLGWERYVEGSVGKVRAPVADHDAMLGEPFVRVLADQLRTSLESLLAGAR